MWGARLALLAAISACHSGASRGGSDAPPATSDAARAAPSLTSSAQLCKLLNERNIFDPTAASATEREITASYLARWSPPDTASVPAYQIVYGVDERVDAAGALGGDFINIAAVTQDDMLYAFGTGAYRASSVHLARKS